MRRIRVLLRRPKACKHDWREVHAQASYPWEQRWERCRLCGEWRKKP